MAEKTFSQQYKMYGNAVDIAFKKYIKATKDYRKFVASELSTYNSFGGPKATVKSTLNKFYICSMIPIHLLNPESLHKNY